MVFILQIVRQLLRSRLSTSHKTIAFKLTDIGEGIAEVELMKWFIKVKRFFL